MSAEPEDLPPAATAEPDQIARTILFKGHTIIVNDRSFTLAMNTVVEGQRADVIAAGLKPE
jgi:hypothetical protein